jgi:hypothetical protein
MAERDFSFLRNVQTCNGAHPASYSMNIRVLSRGVTLLGLDVGLSPPFVAEFKNEWRYTSVPPIYLYDVGLTTLT